MLHRMSSGKMTCVGKRRYWVWGSFREGESGELMMTNVRKGDSDRDVAIGIGGEMAQGRGV